MMGKKNNRMIREYKTVEAMIGIYCGDHHGRNGEGLCPACSSFLTYAHRRLDLCPFQENKTTCAHCPVHCYKPDMREQVGEVMRYAGPRMTFRHPVLALFHLIDGFRKTTPIRSGRKSPAQ